MTDPDSLVARSLVCVPIGFIATPFNDRYDAPRQPGVGNKREGLITLEPNQNFEQALTDLEGFEKIWLIYWFDRNPNWKPMVLPPRSGNTKRGLFATRSPHRPNAIGLSVVDLIEVKGRTLRVGNVDLLDGTPILDIKPYVPYADAYPDATMGWLEERESEPHVVNWSPLAKEQADFLLAEFGIDLITRTNEFLSLDPSPHSYKRITELTDGGFELALKSWRVYFEMRKTNLILVTRIGSGYEPSTIEAATTSELHDGAAHSAFKTRWGR